MCITELSVACCSYGTQNRRKKGKKEGKALKFLKTYPTRSEERREERLGYDNIERNLIKVTERNEVNKEWRLIEVRRK